VKALQELQDVAYSSRYCIKLKLLEQNRLDLAREAPPETFGQTMRMYLCALPVPLTDRDSEKMYRDLHAKLKELGVILVSCSEFKVTEDPSEPAKSAQERLGYLELEFESEEDIDKVNELCTKEFFTTDFFGGGVFLTISNPSCMEYIGI